MTPLADLELPIFAYELLETVASVDIYKNSKKKYPNFGNFELNFITVYLLSFWVVFASVVLDLSINKAKKKICVDGVKKEEVAVLSLQKEFKSWFLLGAAFYFLLPPGNTTRAEFYGDLEHRVFSPALELPTVCLLPPPTTKKRRRRRQQ